MQITQKLFSEFLGYYKNKSASERTIENRRNGFKQFRERLKEEKRSLEVYTEDITLQIIERFKTYLWGLPIPKTSRHYWENETLSPSTVQGKIQTIKCFLKYINILYDEGLTYYKIESPKVLYPKVEILTVDEVLKFVKYVREVETYDINRIRSELLIFLAFKSGMRNSEMINLKLDDVYREDLSIRGKGAKDRMVFIVDHIRKLTEEYKYWRSQPIPRTWFTLPESDRLFISHGHNWGSKLSRWRVCEYFKKYSDWINLGKKVTCHTLRHSFATHLLNEGTDISIIQELLWHSNIQNTMIYIHLSSTKLKKAHSRVFA